MLGPPLAFRAGIWSNATPQQANPYYRDCNRVRFRDGQPEPIGGWVQWSDPDHPLLGRNRKMFQWQANDGRRFGAVGGHRKLYALIGGVAYDITPIVGTYDLPDDPLSTTSGSPVVTVTQTSHGCNDLDFAYLTGLTATGGLQVGGETHSAGSNPFTTIAGSRFVLVALTGHGMASGDFVTISGAASVGGVTPAGLYGVRVLDDDLFEVEVADVAGLDAVGGGASVSIVTWIGYEVTVTGADTYTVTLASNASSTATGGGTAGSVKNELPVGADDDVVDIDQSGGFGVGTYGSGPYGYTTDAGTRIRLWSMDHFGEWLVACPRRGTIYEWKLNASTRAQAVANAPIEVEFVLVTPEGHIMALGAHDGSTFNPRLIRWSDQGVDTTWDDDLTNLARSTLVFEGAGIVGGVLGGGGVIVWTDTAMSVLTYAGDISVVYSRSNLSSHVGLIGPNAFVSDGSFIAWIAPDQQFWLWDGSTPRPLVCPIEDKVFVPNVPLRGARADRIHAFSNSRFREMTWLVPGPDQSDCDRYLTFSPSQEAWSAGSLERIAALSLGSLGAQLMIDREGVIWEHEVDGAGANGGPLEGWIKTPLVSIGNTNDRVDVFGIHPDFSLLRVGVAITIEGREYQDQEPAMIDGPQVITPGYGRADFRASGRLFAVTYATTSDRRSHWSVGAVRADIQPAGTRR